MYMHDKFLHRNIHYIQYTNTILPFFPLAKANCLSVTKIYLHFRLDVFKFYFYWGCSKFLFYLYVHTSILMYICTYIHIPCM